MKKKSVIIGGVIAVGVLAIIAVVVFLATFPVPEASVVALSEPVSVDVARQHMPDFPLPDEATNVLYAEYVEGMAYESMFKCEAPLEVCKSHAVLLLERYNRSSPDQPVPVELREVTEPPAAIPPSPPLNVTWFDVHRVHKGLVGGASGSHRPRIWIDAERNLFYYMYTD